MIRKVCVSHGCADLAVEGGSQCADHAAKTKARSDERKAQAQQSDHAAKWRSLYSDPRWVQASKRLLKEQVVCADCAALNAVVTADVVDHVVRHNGNKELFWDRSNWQCLCTACHNRKTAREVWHGEGADVLDVPTGIKPSQVPVFVMAGQADQIRSQVQRSAGFADQLLDVALIRSAMGVGATDQSALHKRNKLIKRLASGGAGRVWITLPDASEDDLALWLDALGPKAQEFTAPAR